MLASMTGYGRATCQEEDQVITVEIKSVNHRYLDVSVTLPNQWAYLEDVLRRRIMANLKRGKVSVYISLSGSSGSNQQIHVDWKVFDQYIKAFDQMKERLVEDKTSYKVMDFLHLPHLFQTTEIPQASSGLERKIETTLDEALNQLIEMRTREGDYLKNDLLDRLTVLKRGAISIQSQAPRVVEAYHQRLKERIKELLKGQGELDEGRVINEVAIFAEKTDISEEVTRFLSHITQFYTFLNQQGPIGRQLDFLIQEINREVNTMGSKSPDVAITQEVIKLKGELEKIREQVQNIE